MNNFWIRVPELATSLIRKGDHIVSVLGHFGSDWGASTNYTWTTDINYDQIKMLGHLLMGTMLPRTLWRREPQILPARLTPILYLDHGKGPLPSHHHPPLALGAMFRRVPQHS